MAKQTSTTGQLENASKEMIAQARYTEEHNAPIVALIEKFSLARGSDTLVVPKVGQMTMHDLTEGQEITLEEDIGMTTVNISPSEVGGKVILTDKLLRQNTNNIFKMVGKQLGDAMARKKDGDAASLFSALNGGTDVGAAGFVMSASNAVSAIGYAKHNKFGSELRVVHHPSAILRLNRDLAVIGSNQTNQYPIPNGFSQRRLQNFWTGIRIGGVPFFEDGNLSLDSGNDVVGAVMDKGALGMLTSVNMNKERERKPSLRGWVVYLTADYAAFEIDDSRGAPLTFDAGAPSTT